MDPERQIPVIKNSQSIIPPITGFGLSLFHGLFSTALTEYFAVIGFYFGVLIFIALGTFAIVPAGNYEERNVTHAIWLYSMALIFGFIMSPFVSLFGNLIGGLIDSISWCCSE